MAKIKDIQKSKFYLECSFIKEVTIGQSISHDGVCLTVSDIIDDMYEVELMPETFKRSHFRNKKIGEYINLERSMKLDGRFDGHIVQGHTDFVSEITNIKSNDNSWIFTFKIPKEYAKFFVEKGSVSINGISLTIIKASDDFFTVGIIPHTWEVTNFQYLKIGDLVNIETDILAKYFVRMNFNQFPE